MRETIEGEGELFFKPIPGLDMSAGYRVIDRDDARAKAFGFGSAGSNYVNVAAPIDERTHEARADVQYVRESWNIGLNYTGSFFDNDRSSFSVDNPLNDTSTGGSSSLGRFSLAPDNSAHLVSLSGGATLPISFPAQVAASLSWGLSLQDEDFLDVTSNDFYAPNDPLLALPRNDLDGEVRTLHGNFVFTARPHTDWNVKARYRVYDHDNDTDELTFAGEAANDRNLGAPPPGIHTIAYRYTRQNALGEATWRPGQSPVSTTVGFQWEHWNRDKQREVRNTNEYGPSARIDWRASQWARVRAGYTFAARDGSNYDEAGLVGLRRFPQADFLRHRFTLLTQLDPCDEFGVTLTGGFNLTDYDDSDRGLTDDERFDIGIEAGYRPHERVSMWANYGYDYIRLFQEQEQSAGTWDSKALDTAHNGGAGVDFVIIPDLLDAEVSYFIQRGRAETMGGDTAENFPDLKDTLQAVTTGFSLHPMDTLTLRAIYRFEKYDRSNFHEDFPITTDRGDIYLQNRIKDYDAHILSVSAIVTF